MPKLGKDLLADTSAKNTKPKEKPHALRDGGGLWLVIEPTRKKWWKLRTVFAKKENFFPCTMPGRNGKISENR